MNKTQCQTEHDETALRPWAHEAEASRIPELVRFAQRLHLDWEAVEHALLFASSQGQTEGQVNRGQGLQATGRWTRRSCALASSAAASKRPLPRLSKTQNNQSKFHPIYHQARDKRWMVDPGADSGIVTANLVSKHGAIRLPLPGSKPS